MSTLTLGIIVIIYMFVIAWLGYLGYRQTKNASDYLLGGRKVNPIIMALSYGGDLYLGIGDRWFRWRSRYVRHGYSMALLIEHVHGRSGSLYLFRTKDPEVRRGT